MSYVQTNLTSFSDFGPEFLVTAQRPNSVFCGSDDNIYGYKIFAQTPPVETLGSYFYIPPLTDFKVTGANIKMIVTENSTVIIVKGTDYHQMSIHSTGTITRELVESVNMFESVFNFNVKDKYIFGGVAQWIARLPRDRWIHVSREFEPHQRPPLFH